MGERKGGKADEWKGNLLKHTFFKNITGIYVLIITKIKTALEKSTVHRQ